MIEPRMRAVTIEQEASRVPMFGITQAAPVAWGQAAAQATAQVAVKVGHWAGETAQQFAMLVAVLMGPAVLSAYAFAAWSLAGDLGWTNSFIFTSGALSNWIIWLGVAVLVNTAAAILKKHTRADQ